MKRVVRYQGAVVLNGHILLVKQQFTSEYACWNVPGGGREAGETAEQCVVREIKEETDLDVRIERLLVDGPLSCDSTAICGPDQGGENSRATKSTIR